ncbi:MAG TPA: integrase [Chloroflexota bacterium]|nr:integrase [Chloroflexota bacterium]
MLKADQFCAWCQDLQLTEIGVRIVEAIRTGEPMRRVRTTAKNVSGRYPSRKMQRTIQFESHTVELPGIYEMEHAADVAEYYDQPSTFTLSYPGLKGRTVSFRHTPDFFAMRSREAGWEEWKTEQDLTKLAVKMPNRYVRTDDGHWRCPPGERYAEQYGLYYRLRSSAEIESILYRNLQFLEDYLLDERPFVAEDKRATIRQLVQENPGLTLANLLAQPSMTGRADDLYQLIAVDELHVDLRRDPLAEYRLTKVFLDQGVAQAFRHRRDTLSATGLGTPRVLSVTPGARYDWDGLTWELLNAGKVLSLRSSDGRLVALDQDQFDGLVRIGSLRGASAPEDGGGLPEEVRQVLAKSSPRDLEIANFRSEIATAYLSGQGFSGVPDRTVERWAAAYRAAEQKYGWGYVGLIPQPNPGNRSSRFPQTVYDLMSELAVTEFGQPNAPSKKIVYGMLANACTRQGLEAPRYKAWLKALKSFQAHDLDRARRGRRAAYDSEPFYWHLSLDTPRHGDRPWHIAHLDHTQLEIECRCARTGKNLGKPWLSLLMDAYSRRILAMWLTFDEPSYRSCMMTLRVCVRRWGRLPDTVVVDGGTDFRSVYFESLLARYRVTKKTRAGAKPRFGSVGERLFGTVHSEFIHNLQGNSKLTHQDVRVVVPEVNPRGLAIWDLELLYEYLCGWGYEVYDTLEHPALDQSPLDAYLAGLELGGTRDKQRRIPYDEDFIMTTFPTTDKGTAKVDATRGLKINYFYYWHDDFRHPDVSGCSVPVRYDPFYVGHAFAYVLGHWVECVSLDLVRFGDISERELMLASEELRRERKLHGEQFEISARRLAEYLSSAQAEEVLLIQRLKDHAVRPLLLAIERDGRRRGTGDSAVPTAPVAGVREAFALPGPSSSHAPLFPDSDEDDDGEDVITLPSHIDGLEEVG